LSDRTLNLGIVAHVDAGKTTLTERLLHAAGVIEDLGSVDAGTTQTDSLQLERERGITIKSAVVSFPIDDVTVNLIDTPGHPDFIAEVERALIVLDGAVLVISAVEGVQPQTRILMRALRRLGIPTLLFINKIDRRGADDTRVLHEVADRLHMTPVPMGTTRDLGTREARFERFDWTYPDFREAAAAVLAERDDTLLAAYVNDEATLPAERLRDALVAQTRRCAVYPVFCGSAMTGAGVPAVMRAIAQLLPATEGEADAPLTATVFKIDRDAAGHKVAFARVFSGTIRVRDHVRFGDGETGTVTSLAAFEHGGEETRMAVTAGEVAKIRGLAQVRIGDDIGASRSAGARHRFAPPTLESMVVPADPGSGARLRAALQQLAEQDPLIDVRVSDVEGQASVSLYGEVQKEVIQATLARDFGIDVAFHETTQLHVERPLGAGTAIQPMHAATNPYNATIGLRIEPAPEDSGISFRLDVDHRSVPLFIYGTSEEFAACMHRYVRDALGEGLHGWRVTDCLVTMTDCMYSSADGPPSTRGPRSTAADFRKLTPLVVAEALGAARTVVCEPVLRLRLEVPAGTIATVVPALAKRAAAIEAQSPSGSLSTIEVIVAAARAHDLQRDLPGLTGGEGVLESEFAGYRPVTGEPRRRPSSA
jgi:ribosomal protection tetracycline resistance protein